MSRVGIANRICHELRNRIIAGELRMGQRLHDKQLAEDLAVSRTPIREGLLMLQNEGLVVIKPQSGTFVFDLDEDDLHQLCQTRAIMETGALRSGVVSKNCETFARLGQLVSEATIALEDDDLIHCNELDWRFHETLIEATDNKYLVKAYAGIAAKLRALRHHMPQESQRVSDAINQHRRILDLASASRIDAAVLQLDDHVKNVRRLLSAIDEG